MQLKFIVNHCSQYITCEYNGDLSNVTIANHSNCQEDDS